MRLRAVLFLRSACLESFSSASRVLSPGVRTECSNNGSFDVLPKPEEHWQQNARMYSWEISNQGTVSWISVVECRGRWQSGYVWASMQDARGRGLARLFSQWWRPWVWIHSRHDHYKASVIPGLGRQEWGKLLGLADLLGKFQASKRLCLKKQKHDRKKSTKKKP